MSTNKKSVVRSNVVCRWFSKVQKENQLLCCILKIRMYWWLVVVTGYKKLLKNIKIDCRKLQFIMNYPLLQLLKKERDSGNFKFHCQNLQVCMLFLKVKPNPLFISLVMVGCGLLAAIT